LDDIAQDLNNSFPMRTDAASYAVVLVSGGVRSSANDWAGLVVAVDARTGVTVKPLDVVAERDGEDACALRITHEYSMQCIDGSTIMERLTFMPDGLGSVDGEVRDAANVPPMLTERYRVRLNAAEIAMLGGESPERMRGDYVDNDVVNTISLSAGECSLFAAHRALAPASGDWDDLRRGGSESRSILSQDDSQPSDDDAEEAAEKVMMNIDEALERMAAEIIADLSSQVGQNTNDLMDETLMDDGADADANADATEWKGSIAYLREQLRRQSGVCLIIPREDVERLLSDLERTK
jgi:hypothetical protein